MAAQPRQEYRLDLHLRKRRRSSLDKPNLVWKRERGTEDGQLSKTFPVGRNPDGSRDTVCHSKAPSQSTLPSNSKQESILRFFTQHCGSIDDEVVGADSLVEKGHFCGATQQESVVIDSCSDFLNLHTSEESFFEGASVSSLVSSPFERCEEEDIEDDEPLCAVAPERRISFGSSADTLLQQVYDFYGR
ncbi:hypothetical protein GpartN1_g5318.t1 [Galdieria partita]|uniref:Uncharacterized protein n=1 Tax=Galdieria partita TaxID=83374 RepID=A0A9C7Q1M8_9RHOD|nr:hypothetical protein GpartN1_g5318.t1 [Galdieria partita]